jgi:ech hydrogenase subunit F
MANMLQLITRNLFNKKQTRLFPATAERPAFERSRGRIVLDADTCILCSLCAKKCPADAITVDRKGGKWELDAFRCIICGECVTACPKKSISMNNDRRHAAVEKEFVTHKVEVPVPAPKPAAPKPVVATAEASASIQSNKSEIKETSETA